MDDKALFFRREILEWGSRHRRDFPWRNTSNPYQIIVAEMMLGRTRAEQVVPVFREFIRRFPNPRTLAGASDVETKEVLRSLGLFWRAPSFRQMAKQLTEDHGGKVPSNRESLLSLIGVGDYVADAVLCLAFNAPVALVDVNTVRVAGRYLGFPFTSESRRRKAVKLAVASLVDFSKARDSNLAILDFAALVCRAENPLHDRCPVSARCALWQAKLASWREDNCSV